MSESKIHNPEPAILDDRPSKQRDEAVENLRKCALPHIGSEYFRNSESKLGSVSSKTNEQKLQSLGKDNIEIPDIYQHMSKNCS